MENLVSTQWLADALGAPDLFVVDASAHLPAAGCDAATEFHERHISGSCNLPFPLLFGLHLTGAQDMSLYGGGWMDWESAPATPKRMGQSLKGAPA